VADLARRAVLAAGAALPLVAVTGCGIRVLSAPPKQGPAIAGLRSAIAAEQLLISKYQAVLGDLGGASSGALSALLTGLLAEHRAHLDQLRRRLVVPAGSAAASASPGESASAAPAGAGQVPTGSAAAIAFLAAAERGASAALLRRLPSAPSSLAQLYASIAASEATHVPVLRAAERTA
jgi:hypothetical protein